MSETYEELAQIAENRVVQLERELAGLKEKAERYRLEANAMMLQRDEALNRLESERVTRNHIIKKGAFIEKERDEAVAAIRDFAEKHNWAADIWKQQPHIKRLFDIANARFDRKEEAR